MFVLKGKESRAMRKVFSKSSKVYSRIGGKVGVTVKEPI